MDKYTVYDKRILNSDAIKLDENQSLGIGDEMQGVINKMRLEIDARLQQSLANFFNTSVSSFIDMCNQGIIKIVENELPPKPPSYDVFYDDELVLCLQMVQVETPIAGGIKTVITFKSTYERERKQWKISI